MTALQNGAAPSARLLAPTIVEPDARPNDVVDAGLKSLDHYKRALPRWRYRLRQHLLPLIRWETPYLAYFQSAMRSPALDNYFAITANLGTHTFFMIGLPMLYWFGYPAIGKALVHVLATGVFFSGFFKDMCSLPRPLSPPLQRITMSDSVVLEYGFPSTHSTNAVSVAVYAILALQDSDYSPSTKLMSAFLGYFYAASIVIGRLYCGMHGFVDVIFGSFLGSCLGYIEYYWGPALADYMQQSSWKAPALATLFIIALVRVHPEPADDCPCFDDSVAFAGVMIGLEVGTWRYPRLRESLGLASDSIPTLSPIVALARIIFGVLVVFAWRELMKPTMLKTLPHLFRVLEVIGFNLPRRFFMKASEYGKIPEVLRLHTDNVLPSVSDIPIMVRNLQNARRGRSVSIGPQSAADAYETLAYREQRRRESISSQTSLKSRGSFLDLHEQTAPAAPENMAVSTGNSASDRDGKATMRTTGVRRPSLVHRPSLVQFEEMMGQGTVVESTAFPSLSFEEPELYVGRQDELGEKEMFEKLVKPRVRYDVEVVTKLVVYTGIGWLAVEAIPMMFQFIGLGAPYA
ncbi:sphingosine-1-phosphate phosphohydrolase [Grosmannia clavigera kw1407]|uniref:Sphingosine-1-phosphate phosphohydrolase n=1 Tax=Grosmannia clavigera (strain kw1407 / UAMH 11150) TaxID=655863 RepID=F0X7L5_GROCL|nr:sphingosine-1-phosphate phosphohydrolase [Grosmannia clavigera kw1407]EFX06249.1 sphingosine-1-phosphate phosphohydrolase [Grosmannia clavigera kw1407]